MSYYNITIGYFKKACKNEKYNLLYTIESALDQIFLTTEDSMTGMLRMKWWEEKLLEINEKNFRSLNPILMKAKDVFDENQINYLINIIEAKTYEVERYEFLTGTVMVQNYFQKIADNKSLIYFNNDNLTNLLLCVEILKFLEYKDLYTKSNWHLSVGLLSELLTILEHCFRTIIYNTLQGAEKIFYKYIEILLKSIKHNRITISEHYFRIKLAFNMLLP
jgi:hypothetical protein